MEIKTLSIRILMYALSCHILCPNDEKLSAFKQTFNLLPQQLLMDNESASLSWHDIPDLTAHISPHQINSDYYSTDSIVHSQNNTINQLIQDFDPKRSPRLLVVAVVS